MKKYFCLLTLTTAIVLFVQHGIAQEVKYTSSWGKQGISLKHSDRQSLDLIYSISEFTFEDTDVDGGPMKSVKLPGVFLPNNSGAPDLPGTGRYIAIPEGANVTVKILSSRTEVYKDQNISPAPVIPLDTETGPLRYEKDSRIYSTDAFYPKKPVIISEKTQIRGVDVVMLGITPFQYNPVTKELIVYRDIEIELVFEGGNGIVGDERLRSRWFDPILQGAVLNADILPEVDYNKQVLSPTDTPDYEYLIITPNDADFLAWADSIKKFRTLQGIKTGVVTTTDVGGNTVLAIETYVDNAYNSWAVPPAAVLLLGDYSTGTGGIISTLYSHPSSSYPDYASDNRFADVSGNDLPDIVFARITANNASQLEVMITKFLDYERNPPNNPDFYDHPITALGWQTERWFQICSEVVGGYLKNEQGKNPVRINAVYDGDPSSDSWSTATNTTTVVNYFGPNGLGYIPSTPQQLGGFTGGTASQIISAINDGSYLLQHRDHGYYGGWGEPAFNTTSINSLNNTGNELPYIFSINCQTGGFHRSSECFAEKFHRHTYGGQNSGALGLIAATEVSYSFVNDVYIWGVFDNIHPDFMPGHSTQFPNSYVMPAFGNAAGKHFLYQSSWPYNSSSKQVTYRLFHHHGDAFLTLYTEVPQNLAVSHGSVLQAGLTSFMITANSGSLIALTVNGEIIASANGTGYPLNINIPAQNPDEVMTVTITKQNYYRYSSNVDIVSEGLFAQFTADNTTLCLGESVNFTDQSYGSPTSWIWEFPGGSPDSFSGQYPPAIQYSTEGAFDVTLTIVDGTDNDAETKTGYIIVSDITADFTASPTSVIVGGQVSFTDNTSCNPTSWNWSFPGGTPSSSTNQNPSVSYNTVGTYSVTLESTNSGGSDTKTKTNYITVTPPNYCSPSADCSWADGFTDFAFGDISNLNSGCSANGFGDFTNMNTNIESGQSYTIQWETGYDDQDACLWIDFDSDGEFEASERLITDFNLANEGQLYSVNFDIPVGITPGEKRMRIRAKWQTSSSDPCEDFSYGETEDYTVTVISESVEALFTANPTTICKSGQVQFTDQSSGDIVSWLWNFEGGTPTTSTAQNPTITYNEPGNFDVSLTVSGNSSQDNLTKNNFITVNPLPAQANTPQGPTSFCQGTSQSTYSTSGVSGASSYQWIISPSNAATLSGSGTTITTYWQPSFSGQAFIFVKAINACGTGQISDALTVNVNPTPIISCPPDFSICIDAEGFTVSGATPTGGNYSGTGIVADKFLPEIAGEGTHEITYTYTDGNACEADCSFYITVNALPTLSCADDFELCINNGIYNLSNLTSPQDGFFEGNGVENNNFDAEMAGPGTHQITYTFSDNNSCQNECTFNISVNPLPEQAEAINGSTNVCQGDEISYSTNEILYAESYDWEIDPAGAGTIIANDNICSVLWDENYSGDAALSVCGVNDCGSGNWSAALTVTVHICNMGGLPPGWDFTSNPFQHTLRIPLAIDPNIFGEPLQTGDYIGVFYIDESIEKCAGAIEWTGESDLTLMAFGDDPTTPEKDGFDDGETFLWKMYNSAFYEEHPAVAQYDTTFPQVDGTFEPYGVSSLLSLQAFLNQSVIIPQGWSGFSLPVNPINPDLNELFSGIINELILLQNNQFMYWPSQGINSFPGWSETYGAQIKMTGDAFLTVAGIPENNELSLSAGWSYLPISSLCNIDANDLFAPIIDKIEIVKSVAGYQVYWPAMSIYSLNILKPGFSYLIKLTGPVTLNFPECTDKIATIKKPIIPKTWQLVDATPATHTVMIDAGSIANLRAGDFVGSFTENGICTGSVKLKETPVALIVFGDDPLTPQKDGMEENEQLHFRSLNTATGEESNITAVFDEKLPNYSGQFITNGISAFKDSYNGSSGIHESSVQLSVYPNPSNGKFVVTGLSGCESLVIDNMHGQEIFKALLNDGSTIEIDLHDTPKGVYFLIASGQNGKAIQKIVIK